MPDNSKFIELNHQAWNRYTPIHLKSDFYDLQTFYETRNSLNTTELEELGGLKDKSLLHLQCHFGQDTVSLAQLGALTTGVDISEEGINQARILAKDCGIPSEFIESDIYALPEKLKKQFDIVFTSYGVLFWLPDLKLWAETIYKCLIPGGKFYMAEFHPFLDTIDEDFSFFKYSYFGNENGEPIAFSEKGTYADPGADIKSTTYGWPHSLAEVISALSQSGLQIEYLHEFPFSHYNIFPDMTQFSPGKFYHKEIKDSIPYMYSIMARKT